MTLTAIKKELLRRKAFPLFISLLVCTATANAQGANDSKKTGNIWYTYMYNIGITLCSQAQNNAITKEGANYYLNTYFENLKNDLDTEYVPYVIKARAALNGKCEGVF